MLQTNSGYLECHLPFTLSPLFSAALFSSVQVQAGLLEVEVELVEVEVVEVAQSVMQPCLQWQEVEAVWAQLPAWAQLLQDQPVYQEPETRYRRPQSYHNAESHQAHH